MGEGQNCQHALKMSQRDCVPASVIPTVPTPLRQEDTVA